MLCWRSRSDREQVILGCIRNSDFCRHPNFPAGGKRSKLSHQMLSQGGQQEQEVSVWKCIPPGNKMFFWENRDIYATTLSWKERHDSFLMSELEFLSQMALCYLHLLMFNGLQQAGACCSLLQHPLKTMGKWPWNKFKEYLACYIVKFFCNSTGHNEIKANT